MLLLVPIFLLLAGFYRIQQTDVFSPEDLVVALWAKQPMLKNPVAISHDNQGRLYATEANRRKTVDLDVREMKGLEPVPWPALDYSIQSVEQRREVIKTYLDPTNGIDHAWMKDYDGNGVKNWEDLWAKTERVNLLEDLDGDGVADTATVFAEGFNTEVTGTAGGVLWFDNQVYFTVIPDLWKLTDANQDGVADERESLITGHGVHIGQGGHDLHGLRMGPDGRLYWSIGDKGINITSREGRRFVYPNQGVVMRSEPDGSQFEVFAHGLRNCQELAFDDFGYLFCVDNDGDFEGERERLLYVTEGSDTGWRINWQMNHTSKWAPANGLPDYNPWMDERLSVPHFDEQAAYITPTLQNYSDGPAGFIRNPGTALSDAYTDHYFLTQFPGQLITSFQLQPDGAGFRMENESTFFKGFMATGLSFSPDGRLFIADWAGNWTPTENGGIFTIDVPKDKQHPLRDSTEMMIREGMEGRPDTTLITLLNYPDQRIRQTAQFALVRRRAMDLLETTALDPNQALLPRVHSLWGIGQLLRTGQANEALPIETLLTNPIAELRAQAARLIAEAPTLYAAHETDLIARLEDDEPRVRYQAAMALAKVGTDASIEPVYSLLEDNANTDTFIRHAGISALAGIGNASLLAEAHTHPSRYVRRAAVVALRRMAHPSVSAFLDDVDVLVVREAARAIHDDFGIPDALPALADYLVDPTFPGDEIIMRRVLNANLRLGDLDRLDRVLAFASTNASSTSLRNEALAVAHAWQAPPALDRVERRYREIPERAAEDIQQVIQQRLPDLLASTGSSVQRNVYSLINRYDVPFEPRMLQRLVADESRPAAERTEALGLLIHIDNQRSKAVRTAFKSTNDSLRSAALTLLTSVAPGDAIKRIQTVLSNSTSTSERQQAFHMLGTLQSTPQSAAAQSLLLPWIDRLLRNEVAPEERLDIYLAARPYDAFSEELATMEAAVYAREEAYALYGGNVKRGESIYLNHPTAQCIRCHGLGGDGSGVGPNLDGISNTFDRAYLLESLVEPSRTFASGFEAEVSAMPPMDVLLEPGEIRDLIEYLSQL